MTLIAHTMFETTSTVPDNESDYGDFGNDAEEIQIIDSLLAQVNTANNDDQVQPLVVTDIEDYELPKGVLLPKELIQTRLISSQPEWEAELEVLRDLQKSSVDPNRREIEREHTPPQDTADLEGKSPLERFRKPPKKALSVTDLVSPSWCELQYFYVLSKHGRKRRTPAMKQGTAVHKALEDEVHVTVPIQTTKKEDSWGLRFWNICQGLKTLRDTGRTRELEIWGMVGGELVNGIIDEVSYECPDPKYEESIRPKNTALKELPEYQTSITEYLLAKPEANGQPLKGKSKINESWIYLTDVKTRATPTLPTGSSIRPTIVQLHLYHHMLENLVQGNFSLVQLTDRYKLDPHETFSDPFLAQLGNLNQEVFSESSTPPDDVGTLASSQDSMDVLLQHNTLDKLWTFMMEQLKQTFLLDDELQTINTDSQDHVPPASQQSTSDLPPPPSQPTRLSPLLTATYMSSNYKHASDSSQRILGRKSFKFDPTFLHTYLSESLPWWRGEREAKGVALQEAWKCRSCDFRTECSWILERDQLAYDEAMKRKKMREMAGLEEKPDASSMTRSKV